MSKKRKEAEELKQHIFRSVVSQVRLLSNVVSTCAYHVQRRCDPLHLKDGDVDHLANIAGELDESIIRLKNIYNKFPTVHYGNNTHQRKSSSKSRK